MEVSFTQATVRFRDKVQLDSGHELEGTHRIGTAIDGAWVHLDFCEDDAVAAVVSVPSSDIAWIKWPT